jgi:AcrR family transcriptional regulator
MSRGRRQAIVGAAAALFSDRGYHGTSVRDIAEESGILAGSLYTHIRSKEDLLFEIVARAGQQFVHGLEPIALGPGTPVQKLREGMRAHVRVVAGSIDEAKVFLHEWKALDGDRREEVRRLRNRYEALWNDIIEEGIREEAFRSDDPRFARLLILSAANWIYHWYDPAGPLRPDEVADRLTETTLQGLVAGAPRAAREG